MNIQLKDVTLISIDGVGKDENHLKALKYSCNQIDFGAVKFLCPTNFGNNDFYTYEKIEPMSYNQYNEFCLIKMADYIDTKYALIVQDDGFVINPSLWKDEFLNYDYIGAPWPKEHLFFNTRRWPMVHSELVKSNVTYHVGNGGFCLRSKKLMNAVKQLYKQEYYEIPEDGLICIGMRSELENQGCVFCPFELARVFSCESQNVEGIYTQTKDTFGFHGRDTHRLDVSRLNSVYLT